MGKIKTFIGRHVWMPAIHIHCPTVEAPIVGNRSSVRQWLRRHFLNYYGGSKKELKITSHRAVIYALLVFSAFNLTRGMPFAIKNLSEGKLILGLLPIVAQLLILSIIRGRLEVIHDFYIYSVTEASRATKEHRASEESSRMAAVLANGGRGRKKARNEEEKNADSAYIRNARKERARRK